MTKNLMFKAVLVGILLLLPSAAFAADATVTMKGSSGGIGIGIGSGEGVLTYKGWDIPFEYNHNSLGKLGFSSGESTGEVNGLTFLEKFNGCYSTSELNATLIAGGFSGRIKSKSGVTIDLKGRQKGLKVDISVGCAKIKMDPEVLAKVLAELNAPKVEARYQSSLHFDTNSASIRSNDNQTLDDAIAQIKRTPGTEIVVTGYTDTTGTEQYNRMLSEKRASAVLEALTERDESTVISQLPPERVEVAGRGQVPGPANVANQAHRRVDILVIETGQSARAQMKME